MAYKSSARGTAPVRLIVVHTAEGARTAASLGDYFYRDDVQASSHVGIDATSIQQYVSYDRAAWTVRLGNPVSDNAELCAFARWTREQWFSTGAVDRCENPRAILDQTAAWIRSRCLARGIPIRKLSPADVAAGKAGVIGHVDWTLGMHDGTHTDPGSSFPWDYVINQAGTGDWIDTVTPQEFTDAIQTGSEKALRNVFFGVRFADNRNFADEEAQQTGSIISLQAKVDELNKATAETNRLLGQLVTAFTPSVAKP